MNQAFDFCYFDKSSTDKTHLPKVVKHCMPEQFQGNNLL